MASKFTELLDDTSSPADLDLHSSRNVSLAHTLEEMRRRSSSNASNSSSSEKTSRSTSPSHSPTSPTVKTKLRRFTLGKGR